MIADVDPQASAVVGVVLGILGTLLLIVLYGQVLNWRDRQEIREMTLAERARDAALDALGRALHALDAGEMDHLADELELGRRALALARPTLGLRSAPGIRIQETGVREERRPSP